jgi:hypothetical protein
MNAVYVSELFGNIPQRVRCKMQRESANLVSIVIVITVIKNNVQRRACCIFALSRPSASMEDCRLVFAVTQLQNTSIANANKLMESRLHFHGNRYSTR